MNDSTLDWKTVTPAEILALVNGKSYGQIAKLYGISRNTVSGRIYRWRLEGKFPPAQLVTRASNKPKTVRYKKGLQFTLSGKTIRNELHKDYKPYVPVVPEGIEPPTNDPVPLDDLTSFMCAVVVQERPPRYCGCTPLKHQRFRMCAYHASYMVEDMKVRQDNQVRRRQIARRSGNV